jgi:NitT/TauT family transport system substrate-binding protein
MHSASPQVESAFAMPVSSNERPLEPTTIRLRRDAGMCVAPWYVGEELLRAEGFTDIRYVPVRAGLQQ